MKNQITGFVIMGAPAESHRTMDSSEQGKRWWEIIVVNALFKHIKDTSHKSANAPAKWTRQTHPCTCAAQSGTIWASHQCSTERVEHRFSCLRKKHPGPAPHDQTQLWVTQCTSWLAGDADFGRGPIIVLSAFSSFICPLLRPLHL